MGAGPGSRGTHLLPSALSGQRHAYARTESSESRPAPRPGKPSHGVRVRGPVGGSPDSTKRRLDVPVAQEVADDGNILIGVREMGKVTCAGEGLSSHVGEQRSEHFDDRSEHRRALASLGEKDRDADVLQGLRLSPKCIAVTQLAEERSSITN